MEAVDYWDLEMRKRFDPQKGHINFNLKKAAKLVSELMRREHFIDAFKLDIGCGIAPHAIMLSSIFKHWRTRWTGVDISPFAVEQMNRMGFDTYCCDVLDFNPDHKFDVFLFMDSFEHLMNHEALGQKIQSLGNEKFTVFGNVPLYSVAHAVNANVEREIGPDIIEKFIFECGCHEMKAEVFGAGFYPYLIFEGIKR